MRHRLYKYYSDRKWADTFLDGELLFRPLSYFRDYEDANVRKDRNEGVSRFRPEAGLVGYNQTQGRSFTLPHHAFESSAKADEIFVFCLSTVCSEELRAEFDAVACVEIGNIGAFCHRVKVALPPTATFFGRRVQYYKPSDPPEARWALPDLIATSKFDNYAWQWEYRLIFSLNDALDFEKVALVLKPDGAAEAPKLSEHPTYLLKTRGLRDICRLCQP